MSFILLCTDGKRNVDKTDIDCGGDYNFCENNKIIDMGG
jgi:hypothetical protein